MVRREKIIIPKHAKKNNHTRSFVRSLEQAVCKTAFQRDIVGSIKGTFTREVDIDCLSKTLER